MVTGKKGYSNHPETVLWADLGWTLRQRHQLLSAEMTLRGFTDKTPVVTRTKKDKWPQIYIDEPFRQFQILEAKYQDKEPGRIPLSKNAQQLRSQHKYSVLARAQNLYKKVGQDVTGTKSGDDFAELTKRLTEALRQAPSIGELRNALQHMWGHVSDCPAVPKSDVESWSLSRLLEEIQRRTLANEEP